MRMLKGRAGHLSYVDCHQGLWESPELAGLDDRGDGASVHVLKNNIEVGASLEGADVFHDVLVVQVLQELDLSHDALQRFS